MNPVDVLDRYNSAAFRVKEARAILDELHGMLARLGDPRGDKAQAVERSILTLSATAHGLEEKILEQRELFLAAFGNAVIVIKALQEERKP